MRFTAYTSVTVVLLGILPTEEKEVVTDVHITTVANCVHIIVHAKIAHNAIHFHINNTMNLQVHIIILTYPH